MKNHQNANNHIVHHSMKISTPYTEAISIENLCKSYKDFQLDNVSLHVPMGTVMGFVGQNGSGKTTTIKSILNLIKTDSGTIQVLGHDAFTDSVLAKQEIGIVFDELGVPDTLNCNMIDKIMKNIYKNWDSDEFFRYTDVFKLPRDKVLKKFSRGMQMKSQMAIALSHHANLLILDEATAGLDPVARNELLDMLLDYMEDENHSILMSSHITSDLERVADYITFIDNGKIILTDEKYHLSETHMIVKGSTKEIETLPKELIVSVRKNSYGCEALTNHPDSLKELTPNLVYDKASFDDILCFYIKKP